MEIHPHPTLKFQEPPATLQKLLPNSLVRLLQAVLLGLAAIFLALHYIHLAADFPNYSPWMDWSKYTDEGWYGDAAIRHFQLGHWYVPGDFNPAAALPVWPFVEALLFRLTGVSLVAVRALTVSVLAAILVGSFLLLHRWRSTGRTGERTLAPAVAVFLLALSPFVFVFTRMAILEPMLVLLTLLSLLAASAANSPTGVPRRLPVFALGVLLPALILTKTTALFLFPAIFFLLFAVFHYRLKPFLRAAIPAGILALFLWLLWFGLIVRSGLLLDYRYLFSANAYTGITRANALKVLADTLKDGLWIGNILFPCALAALALALASWRRLRDYPLVPTLILWAAGYTAFLAYHDNLQPRYYLVVAVPLTLLVPVVLELFLLDRLAFRITSPSLHGVALAVGGLLVVAIALPDARETLHFLRHPDYTLLGAARQLDHYIAEDRKRDPAHSSLVLSISGSDLSLMTGLHSINDDFGTLELINRVAQYRPGWYAAWNQIDDDKMEALTPYFRVERVAEFPSMDDPDRNVLILYRLDDVAQTPPRKHRGKPIPRSLRTKVGQQPSTTQLEH